MKQARYDRYGRSFNRSLWESLERESKSSSAKAPTIRAQALEWLRLESKYRGWSDRCLAEFERDPSLQPWEYAKIKRDEHDCLLNEFPISIWPLMIPEWLRAFPHPPVTKLEPLRLSLNAGSPISASIPNFAGNISRSLYFDSDRLLVSLDASAPLAQISDEIKRIVTAAQTRHSSNRKRARGAGRPITLNRMAEALWAHDQVYLKTMTKQQAGSEARSFARIARTQKDWDNRGAELGKLAKRMIALAQTAPEHWFLTFK